MSAPADQKGQQWSSRIMFLIATIGFAIGLGNIWRFPYLAGENGGGAFIVVYVLSVILVGLPLVVAELAVGREGGPDVPRAWRNVAVARQASPAWQAAGLLGVVASFAIVSFYCVIGGWTMAYAWDSLAGIFASGPRLDYKAFLADPLALTFWQTLYLGANLLIVRAGMRGGLEPALTAMMPLLLFLLLGMLGLAVAKGAFAEAAAFLFTFNFSEITPKVIAQAVGQAFFSAGIGSAVLITYGGYLGPDAKLGRLSIIIVFADTMMALLAGLVIFPFLFTAGFPTGQGPTLVFVTMQAAFAAIPGGAWLSVVFFSLILVAALTSTVAMFEMLAAIGEARAISRSKMLGWSGLVLWVLGLGTVASFNIAKNFHPLGSLSIFAEATIFETIDILTSNIALPLGGFLLALLIGWVTPAQSWAQSLAWESHPLLLKGWLWLMRIVIPAILLVVMFASLSG